MENRVDKLVKCTESYAVKFLEFTRIHACNKNLLICIFEGEDEKYYAIRLSLLIGQGRWHGINAGGKGVVLDLYSAIVANENYKDSCFACFIDMDFDDCYCNPDPERIYVTPCYSVENLFTTTACFERVLSAEFNIKEFGPSEEEFQKCVASFRDRMSEFIEAITPFNIWVKTHRKMIGNAGFVKLNVSNVNTRSLVTIRLDTVIRRYNENDMTTVFSDYNGPQLIDDACLVTRQSFIGKNKNYHFRGKQQVYFMRTYLSLLKDDINSLCPQFFSRRGNVSLALSKSNFISDLSQYADTPDCLMDFLRSISCAHAYA